ncbi:MAG: hypothetical protein KAU17_09310 [Spirochaetales bacterium]|nr:hypothetical protein [Spirochaetales bacterium]
MKPIFSISSPSLNCLSGNPYYNLPGTLSIMKRLYREGFIDGFEFQYLIEWVPGKPPRAEIKNRLPAWKKSKKYSVDELIHLLKQADIPIQSIHAPRDIGTRLCSDDPDIINSGISLIRDSLTLARDTGAKICVFHLWDTWKEDFQPAFLRTVFFKETSQYPGITAAVENIPTHLAAATPYALVRDFDHITLDLRWAARYGDFSKYEALADKIVNVHLSGVLKEGHWRMDPSWFPKRAEPFRLQDAIATIRRKWRSEALFTLEPCGLSAKVDWIEFIGSMKELKVYCT